MSGNILEVKDLKAYFYPSSGAVVKAVDGVSFNIARGSVFGLVGESGSGKTLTALSILKLINPPGRIIDGRILFNGADILEKDEGYMRALRGAKISIVFQEPSSAFNPVFTMGDQLTEAVLAHQDITKGSARDLVMEFLKRVNIPDPERVVNSYPHQLSGGMKQRAMIAMALVNSPELVILDEPTTALDVTIQAQILDMLGEIIEEEKLSILFISHDFGIIARMCDHVAVMLKGRICESGDKSRVLSNPKEKYTIELLESVKALS